MVMLAAMMIAVFVIPVLYQLYSLDFKFFYNLPSVRIPVLLLYNMSVALNGV